MASKKEIRVFISSTFLDMHKERDYLNRIVFPKLRKISAERGVSFYAIDLRWGVTEEETQLNRTIDICLDQVKECIPFFIGLIGNRYGWIPDQNNLLDKYPWISDYGDISATEIEIRYYLKKANEKHRSFFAIKGSSLCQSDFDDGHNVELKRLTDAICAETGREPFKYDTIEELGEAIYQYFIDILNKEYPEEENNSQFKLNRYLKEIEEYDISNEFQRMEQDNWQSDGNPFLFARRDPMNFEIVEKAFLSFHNVVLVEEAGTEQLCNRYIHHVISYILPISHPQINSILLMLDADDCLRTPLSIMEELCAQLNKYVEDSERYSPFKTNITGTERLHLLQLQAISMLKHLKTEDILICITNLHLLNSSSPWYYLPFLVVFSQSNVRLVLTTADRKQTKLLQITGMLVRNFPIKLENSERAGFFAALIRSLELEGKHLEKEHLDKFIHSSWLKDMESAKFIANYLKNYVVFEDLSETLIKILPLAEETNVYNAVWQIAKQKLTNDDRFSKTEQQEIFRISGNIFHMLCHLSIKDEYLYRIFTQENNVSKYMYIEAFSLIHPFLIFDGSGLCIYNQTCKQVLSEVFKDISYAMGKELVSAVLDELDISWRYIDESYGLLRYLVAACDNDLIIRLVTNNRWLQFVRNSDFRLLAMGWAALKKSGLLDVKKIYSESNHISEDFTMTTSLSTYDLLMRMELAVAGTNSIESFLDIPYYYSTDIDEEFKENWQKEDYMAIRNLRENVSNMDVSQLRQFPKQLADAYGLRPEVASFVWEVICRELAKRNSLTAEDAIQYLFHASRIANLRQIADAILYLGELEDVFSLIR